MHFLQPLVYCKFIAESNNERTLNIG